MGYDSGSSSEDGRDDDEEEEYEDVGGGNRFLGFMFGNVDNSGDLDIDYLDEDAKEHLAALADTLGSSLTDIDLSVKSSHAPGDAAEQDYDEKAEDAVDYEDIDEQYEGPEILAAGEEDYLLPRNKYFSAEASVATVESKASVFDDENYDDDVEFEKEQEGVESTVEVESNSLQGVEGECLAVASEGEKYFENDLQLGSLDAENLAADLEEFQEEELEVLKGPLDGKGSASLPILCIEDGMVILRFSEIFGIHEPLKRGGKRDRRHFNAKEIKYVEASDIVEDDEEAFLKESGRGFSFMKQSHATQHDVSVFSDGDSQLANFGFVQGAATDAMEYDEYRKDSCLREEPMKEDSKIDPFVGWSSPLSPKFYPLDQEDWEDRIVWDNSPAASDNFVESCEISGPDLESLVIRGTHPETEPQNLQTKPSLEQDEKDFPFFLHGSAGLLEPFGSRKSLGPTDLLLESSYHPQLLRLESRFEVDDSNHADGKDTATDELPRSDTLRRFSKLALQNRDILDGSWLDKIIWEPYKPIAKPKLILDLQDEQMLFEILDNVDGKNLTLHAGAMVITRSTKSSTGDSLELPGHGGQSGWRFNIANDKFYSNRKTSQQQRLTSKKRVGHGIKVHHSIPALKLETMKLKLSNKDIANFHRPKALWYPHDNEVAVKEQGKLPTQGPMKIILKSLGGKGSKIHVDGDETLSSVKAKASKKLDFKPSESVKIFYSGKMLDDNKSLAAQNVQPNSLLHLVRTKVHLLPRAQKLPGENKSLRPPGAFKKKSDLSMKDGHAFLMEYCEERPLMLSNVGMGARLCTYYQKSSPGDQTGTLLHNGNSSLGSVLTLDPADKSPFLGDLRGGFSQSSLETNMYRAPVFPHKVPATDYLLVRSAKGKLSIRRIDRIHVVGQQEPLVEVMSPGAKTLQSYLMNRLFVYVCREFRAIEKRGMLPTIRADDVSGQFPGLSENNIRKRLKELAAWQRSSSGQWLYVMKRSARIPSEEELRKLVPPENVCAYESMQAGVYRLKHLGITRLTHPAGISSAMSQLPDEAITLAAASHIERELQITPWNLSSNFVACINQGRENIERLEISGVGDPSGRGLGFSYVRTAPKAPMSSAMVKKKTAAGRGGSTVTGTDADLRRLSMEAAREVLLKFNVPEEMIAKQTRWHRIAMIRKLSSEQAASGVKVDPTTISKYARGQRMSFLQLQQQTREKCQEIWDRQVQSLSAVDGDENESDSEADLDSFAGDLENLLDAEECEEGEEGNYESMPDKADGVKGLKMRRRPSQAQAEEEIEDEEAEAAELFRMLMDDDEAERRKKKKIRAVGEDTGLPPGLQSSFGFENAERSNKSGRIIKQIVSTAQPDGSYTSKDNITRDPREFESFLAKRNVSGKMKAMKDNDIARMGLPNKKVKILSDGVKIFKEKKSARERFVCGACGQLGHMRTNKNCPKYREDTDKQLETTNLEKAPGKSNSLDPSSQSLKTLNKKPIPKSATKLPLVEATEGDKSSSKANVPPVKFKCGSADKISDKVACGAAESSEQPVTSDAESGKKSVKVNKIKFSNKKKPEDVQGEYQKPAIVFRPPTDTDRGPVESHKPSIVLRPPTVADRDQVESHKPSIVLRPPAEIDREQPHKKIIIKRSKEIIDLDQVSQDGSTGHQSRKIKKIVELSSFEKNGKYESTRLTEESTKRNAREDRRWWEEEEKKRYAERHKEQKARRLQEERKRMLEEQERFSEIKRYEEAIRREWEEEELQKAAKKKKKKRPEIRESYLEDQRARRNDRRMPERDRSAKRKPVSELGRYGTESTAATKRRRGGEVGLANILERIVEALKDRYEVSYLFLKPVPKKEAPDYLDIIERPMDLSTIREKVRKMEYSDREGFRHDVWQITYNAHRYNDGRNPGIPPLADQLLEICDYLLSENDESLTEAEESIRYRDT